MIRAGLVKESANADVTLFRNHCSYAGIRVFTGQACHCMISPSAFLQYSTPRGIILPLRDKNQTSVVA